MEKVRLWLTLLHPLSPLLWKSELEKRGAGRASEGLGRKQLLQLQEITMASKYAFAQGLKELRFHLCQTSEHSAAVRYELAELYALNLD